MPHFSFRPSPKTGHPSHLSKLPIPCEALGIEVCDPLKNNTSFPKFEKNSGSKILKMNEKNSKRK